MVLDRPFEALVDLGTLVGPPNCSGSVRQADRRAEDAGAEVTARDSVLG